MCVCMKGIIVVVSIEYMETLVITGGIEVVEGGQKRAGLFWGSG